MVRDETREMAPHHSLKKTRNVLRSFERRLPAGVTLARSLFRVAVKLSNARQVRAGRWGTTSSFIAITTRVGCRCACEYCPQDLFHKAYARRATRAGMQAGGTSSEEQSMTVERFRGFLDRIPRRMSINFAGFSEPWLNPECREMVQEASERGYRLRLITTLAGMSPEDIAYLSRIPFQSFRVHLPANEKVRHGWTDHRMCHTLDAIMAAGISNLAFHHHGGNPRADAVQRLGRFQIQWEELHNRAGNLTRDGVARVEKRIQGRIRCGHDPRSDELDHNILLPNGDLALCCMDWGLDHVIGNLIHTDLETIYRSESYLTLKRGLKDESVETICRHCTLAVPCDSGSKSGCPDGR